MAIRPLDLMEPEETVGNLWHDLAAGVDAARSHPDAAVALASLRPSLGLLLRALGGGAAVEIAEAPATASRHRLGALRSLGVAQETEHLPRFDGERLGLPPVIDAFPSHDLNRAAYLWLTALAACAEIPAAQADPLAGDLAQIDAMRVASARVRALCPGLRDADRAMRRHALAARRAIDLPTAERAAEAALRAALTGDAPPPAPGPTTRGYMPFAPVASWLVLAPPPHGGTKAEDADPSGPEATAATAAMTNRKRAARKDRDEANRRDSFILHRFESILSWAQSMNLNRMIDDDDDKTAAKAADDQDAITLSRHDRRVATRLRMHLDLSPADADHERIADIFTYPEWNHRARAMMPDHCRVLEIAAAPDPANGVAADPRALARVRRQFEALRPRRILRPRQIDGEELDLDALIAARVEMAATGRSSDRIYQSMRATARDLSVGFLIDTSRSTEAAVGDATILDVSRQALAALAGGIDAAGDRLGIWGFSSLRRDRVFLSRCKAFDEAMSPAITARICGLRPGHYTRLGAAIRHVSAAMERETASRKLLLVLTDGKPNDLDHYEGLHGIEDSAMAVREARRAGRIVHGVVIDADGQDWFARIFGRGGFSLLPDPARLPRALPDIYRSLMQEK